jgi:AP-4 complex subunit mu-1
MKSFLQGNPPLKLALNEGLVVGKTSANAEFAGVCVLDDCNFHECANLEDFDSGRTLSFTPPDGEFVVMNYRITSDFKAPFRIFPFFELTSPYKVELVITIRAEIPRQNYGGNVTITVPMPKKATSVATEMAQGAVGHTASYDAKTQQVSWVIKKFQGESEATLRMKISLATAHTASVRKEIGPISMNFEVPMFNPSGLQVRYLRVMAEADYNPYRWVRYITRSSSYVCRC